MDITVNAWIELSQGYGLTRGVYPLYFESWQKIPEDKSEGDYQLTMIVGKQLCDFCFKNKIRVAVENSRLCKLASGAVVIKLNAILADSKVQRKFDALEVPENLGGIHLFVVDLPFDEADECLVKVAAFSESHKNGFTFDAFRQALPKVCASFLSSYGPVPSEGKRRIEINLFNHMFALNDQKQRIFTKASCM